MTASYPPQSFGSSWKSIEMCFQGLSGIGRGFKSPGVLSWGIIDQQQSLQFHTYQMHRKGAYSEADLLAIAQRLYNAPDLQFWVPGQWNGVLAIMGPQPAEQLIQVIGTA